MFGSEQERISKLLIVDDEIEILEWLEELFTYDFSRKLEIHTASSAPQALQLLDKVAFDVVLTDIKMPAMDGLTFYKKIKENWKECKVVFLTGYRNFEDIYKVTRDRDVRYILKSEDDDVIMQAIEAAFAEVDAGIENKHRLEVQKSYMEKAHYWIKRDYMEYLVRNPQHWTQKQTEAQELGISFDFSRTMLVCLIRIDSMWGNDTDKSIIMEQYAGGIREYLPDWIDMEKSAFEGSFLMLLIQAKDRDSVQWERLYAVTQGAIELSQRACEAQQCSYSVVISSRPVELSEAYDVAGRLKEIMAGYSGNMKSAIIHAEKTEELLLPDKKLPVKDFDYNQLKYYLELHQKEEYFILLNEICSKLNISEGRHDMYAMEMYFNVSTTLLHFINANHLQEKLAFKIGLYKLLNVDEHKSWSDAGMYLTELSQEIFEILGDYESTLAQRALTRIVDYIEEHISGDLSLTNLAAVGGFNASYLSRLFKQVHNENLTDYVLKKRMELAKQLLSQTQERVQIIGERAGYTSSNSFSRAFRGYTGLSPVEYREAAGSKQVNDR